MKQNFAVRTDDLIILSSSKDALSAYTDALAFGKMDISAGLRTLEMPEQQWLKFSYLSIQNSRKLLNAILDPVMRERVGDIINTRKGLSASMFGLFRQGEQLSFEMRSGGK